MALATHFIILALAAAQPQTGGKEGAAAEPAAPVASAGVDATAAVLDLFERVCGGNEQAPGGFDVVQWSDFPQALVLMNTYGHGGTFLRSATGEAYIARTQGQAHMGPGRETRCAVAARGIDAARIVAHLAERTGAPAVPLQVEGVSANMLISDRGAFTVYDVADDWVIVRSMGILIPAEMLRQGNRRPRRGDRK